MRKLQYRIREHWQLFVFLLPPAVYCAVFCYAPMVGAQIAFRKYSGRLGIWGSKWVGLANFVKFIESYQFERVLSNTLLLSLYVIICSFPIPIIFALMLNSIRSRRFRSITHSIVNLPHFISVVVLVGIMQQLFNSRTGLYGSAVLALTGTYPSDLFGVPANFRNFYVWSGVWQEFGWSAIIYVSALTSISPELHEAAQIDGASRFQRILHVDLPGILPTVTVMLVLRMGSVMTIGYEKVYLMQNDLNLSASEVISTYVYKIGLSSAGTTDFSYATAIGLFNSVVNFALIVTSNGISRRLSETSLF